MVDHLRQAIDVVIPCLPGLDGSDDEEEKIVDISSYGSNTRPLYLIKRKEDIELIRKRLSAKKRVLLRAFSTNAYYSCDIAEMQQKVLQHMTSTGAYALIMALDKTKQRCIDTCLNNMDERVTCKLSRLLHDQSITFAQWQEMRVDRLESRLDSLYFLPNTRRVSPMTNLFLLIFFRLI